MFSDLHDFCETDESCYDVNFSHCSEGTCSCIINYVEINGSCLGLIGSKCSDYSECAAEHSICDRESCQCSTNFYPSVNNDKCYKYAESKFFLSKIIQTNYFNFDMLLLKL